MSGVMVSERSSDSAHLAQPRRSTAPPSLPSLSGGRDIRGVGSATRVDLPCLGVWNIAA